MSGRDGVFPSDAVVRRVDKEAVLVLGGGRALLMQLAHPLVAKGVAEHSGFEADPWSRLVRTLQAGYTIVFGTREEADQTAAVVHAVHERVTGEGYQANDPALLMWVHATLVDTALRVHTRFLGPLSRRDAARYYRESMIVAEMLGVPHSEQPPDIVAFRAYVRQMVATLEVSDEARQLAAAVLHPRMPWMAEPLFELGRQLTVGLLPRPLREQFGFGWDRNRKAALLAAGLASRQVLPRLPTVLRKVPAGAL
ncbi:MAG: hypothetical protein QOJ09_2228 [Actinomycetota bacterium]|nr:hypothetical protein [Actinomycetota bacterium]